MFIELHTADDNKKIMLNINQIQCIGQTSGVAYIDFGDDIYGVKESYEHIRQAISKITMIENVESEDNENGND